MSIALLPQRNRITHDICGSSSNSNSSGGSSSGSFRCYRFCHCCNSMILLVAVVFVVVTKLAIINLFLVTLIVASTDS